MDIKIRETPDRASRLRWLALSVAALGSVLVALVIWKPVGAPRSSDSWSIAVVMHGDLSPSIRAQARFEPLSEHLIAAPVSASVLRVPVQPGSRIDAGVVLIELQSREIAKGLADAELRAAAAEAEYQRELLDIAEQGMVAEGAVMEAESELRSVTAELNAEQELASSGISSRLSLMRAQERHTLAGARLGLARKKLDFTAAAGKAQSAAARQGLEIARRDRDEHVRISEALIIRTESPGIVAELAVRPGQTVTAGEQLGVLIGEGFRLEAEVIESQAHMLAPGLRVKGFGPGGAVVGTVASVSATAHGGLVRAAIELDDVLAPGYRRAQTISLQINLAEHLGVLHVEAPAGIRSGSEALVYRIEENGTVARPVRVQFGAVTPDGAVVLAGLRVGDRIITNPPVDRPEEMRL
jgi:HlyD family secretion protein